MFESGALSAVDYPEASSLTLAFSEWLQGTVGRVGESSGIDRLTDVPEFGWMRRRLSPECRDADYCELRVDGILGSTHGPGPMLPIPTDALSALLERALRREAAPTAGSATFRKEMLTSVGLKA